MNDVVANTEDSRASEGLVKPEYFKHGQIIVFQVNTPISALAGKPETVSLASMYPSIYVPGSIPAPSPL